MPHEFALSLIDDHNELIDDFDRTCGLAMDMKCGAWDPYDLTIYTKKHFPQHTRMKDQTLKLSSYQKFLAQIHDHAEALIDLGFLYQETPQVMELRMRWLNGLTPLNPLEIDTQKAADMLEDAEIALNALKNRYYPVEHLLDKFHDATTDSPAKRYHGIRTKDVGLQHIAEHDQRMIDAHDRIARAYIEMNQIEMTSTLLMYERETTSERRPSPTKLRACARNVRRQGRLSFDNMITAGHYIKRANNVLGNYARLADKFESYRPLGL